MERSSHDAKGFRAWYYFRMGWGYYFAFIFAAINTLTVTYFLAIENYPALEVIFPSFEIYIIIICSIGIPLLVTIGYAHYKRTKARKDNSNSHWNILKIKSINYISPRNNVLISAG